MSSRSATESLSDLLQLGIAKYSGDRGKGFHQLLQRIQPPIHRRRANKLAEGKDVDVGADLVDF